MNKEEEEKEEEEEKAVKCFILGCDWEENPKNEIDFTGS